LYNYKYYKILSVTITKKKLPYDPAIPFQGVYLKEMKPLSQRDSCTPVFIAALFTVAKT